MRTIISDRERGAVAPFVAILMVVFILCVALVVDLGHLHNVKVQLQRAVDAAALAAAQQLTGQSGQGARAINVARATADINRIDDSAGWVGGAQAFTTVLGNWDKDALGASAATRFTTAADPDTADAVKVSATLNVNYFFFIFAGNGTVSADAIAVAAPESPVLPLAVITCIPADKMLENPGALPGMTPCDITSYDLGNDQDDTMAWTSLTFGANANDIIDYMATNEGKDKFNKVIFGKGLPGTKGIENEAVTSGECYPDGFTIPCGLGQIGSEDIAPAGAFPVPAGISPLSATPGEPAAGFDPLYAYGANGSLPRWYNNNNGDTDFDSSDHFTRVWSQDGILLQGAGETTNDFIARLKTYAECPAGDLTCRPYDDDRFVYVDNSNSIIIKPTGQLAQNLQDTFGFLPEYWPNFTEVTRRAGYPKVGVINGKTQTVLDAFVDNTNVSDGTDLKCSDNDPFPAGQTTLRINAPVIFAGACEDWKAISNNPAGHTLTYIGLSKFLLTRAWIKNNESYDCGDVTEVVQLPAGGCTGVTFDPALDGIYFSVDGVTVPASYRGLEGLSTVPTPDGEDAQGSILHIYLVE